MAAVSNTYQRIQSIRDHSNSVALRKILEGFLRDPDFLALRGAGDIATNVAVGPNTLDANTTGANNVAVGYQALDANTIGVRNVGAGSAALGANTTGTDNVAENGR